MFLWSCLTPFLLITVHLCQGSPDQRCGKFTDLSFIHAIIGTSLKVNLLLYTRHNVSCGVVLSHTKLEEHPEFSMSKPTTFIIHGYRPSGSPPVWLDNFTEWLLARQDINVVVVDWNHGATYVNYFKVVEKTYEVADNLTAFIKIMQDHGASLSSIHFIGVSLGAHISGFVGAKLKSAIGRITALDPAGPSFIGKPPEHRLDPTDAQFVDVLHTDIDFLGFRAPMGHIDFYPNGGTDQPGCPKTLLSPGAYLKCDHQRAVSLFMDTINDSCPSRAFPCSSYEDFLDGKCTSCERFGEAGCPIFGYDVTQWKDVLNQPSQTKFYFKTNSHSPYCLANYKVDVTIWNQKAQKGYLDIKINNGTNETVAVIEHKAIKFTKDKETTILAMFARNIHPVKTVSVKYYGGEGCNSNYKLRILGIRLTPLNRKMKTLCRHDFLLEHEKEFTFKPIPCA